jgi:hypothetical protein
VKVHSTGKHVNAVMGISDERAYELIEITRPLWEKLVSGTERENLTVSDIFMFIINHEKLTVTEKCFLCSHISRSFEIVIISEMFLNNQPEEFMSEIGLIKK